MSARNARRFLANLRIERDNAALYERLADLAGDERKQRAYRRIALAETANAAFWEAQLHAMQDAIVAAVERGDAAAERIEWELHALVNRLAQAEKLRWLLRLTV